MRGVKVKLRACIILTAMCIVLTGCNEQEDTGIFAKAKKTEYEEDGIKYIKEEGSRVTIAYPVIDAGQFEEYEEEQVASYSSSASGNVDSARDYGYYYITGMDWTQVYIDETIERIEYTFYNGRAFFSNQRLNDISMSNGNYTGRAVSVGLSGQSDLYLNMALEFKATDKEYQSNRQTDFSEEKAFAEILENGIIGAKLYYKDGTQRQEYLKIKTSSESRWSSGSIYRLVEK